MAQPMNRTAMPGLMLALALMAGISCIDTEKVKQEAQRSATLGHPAIAEAWVTTKSSAVEAVDVDLSSMGLEKLPISEVALGGNHASSATASYWNPAGNEVARLIAIQYPSVAAMERNKGGGLPYFELEESLADLYCHRPECNWDFYMFETWIFVVMFFEQDFQRIKDGVYDVLSGNLPFLTPTPSAVTPTPTPTPVPATAIGVSAGGQSCAVTTEGALKCWGPQTIGGQHVDGSGLTSGVATVSVGSVFTCVVTIEGGVMCWGWNKEGQLGDGTYINQSAPAYVTGLTEGVAVISARYKHACAITTVGGVKCWGKGEYGRLGNGTGGNQDMPVDVIGLESGVVGVSTGPEHTCAVTAVGAVKCWGLNIHGKLGVDPDTTAISMVPVDVPGLTSGVVAVSAGWQHTCALTTTGGVKCWGYNRGGQLGDGTNIDRSTPVDVVGLASGVRAISAGSNTCAVTVSGGLKCWGRWYGGQGGSIPEDLVDATSGVAAVSVGLFSSSCLLTVTGGVKCWGQNVAGKLGDGTTTDRRTPVDVVVFTRN